jgi:hypothetical protein
VKEKAENFLVSSAARCPKGAPDLHPGVNCVFEMPKGAKVETDLPLGKAALSVMETVWPISLPFTELFERSVQRLKQDGIPTGQGQAERETLREFLLRLHHAGAVEFRVNLPAVARKAGERPIVHPIARWQVRHGTTVASLLHMAVKVEDEIGRSLLSWLDGTLDRKMLLEKVWQLTNSGKMPVAAGGNDAAARSDLEFKLEQNLEKLARLGLLVA